MHRHAVNPQSLWEQQQEEMGRRQRKQQLRARRRDKKNVGAKPVSPPSATSRRNNVAPLLGSQLRRVRGNDFTSAQDCRSGPHDKLFGLLLRLVASFVFGDELGLVDSHILNDDLDDQLNAHWSRLRLGALWSASRTFASNPSVLYPIHCSYFAPRATASRPGSSTASATTKAQRLQWHAS